MKRPLSVVGTDQEALKALLSLHAPPEPRILDVTANRGRFWRGLPYKPHRLDRDPVLFEEGFTDTIADFRALPFGPGDFDVIVFDPPHIPENAGAFRNAHATKHGNQRWTEKFGTAADDIGQEDVSGLFEPFLKEARRVLVPRAGVVLAKISDQVHRGAYRWQHVRLIKAAAETGFTACDLILRLSLAGRANMIDPKWKHVCHVRQVHTYWLCFRNGSECVSRTAPRVDVKPRTEGMFSEAPA